MANRFAVIILSFLFFTVNAQQHSATPGLILSHYIAGIANPEDLIEIPESDWVIVSSMASDKKSSGVIFAVHKKDETILSLFALDSHKPDQQDGLTLFAPHGIYIRKMERGVYHLFVINHGSREAIEIFYVSLTPSGTPQLTWERHIDFPGNVWANGLVVDATGKIYTTCMYDPTDKQFLDKFEHKLSTGQVWMWTDLLEWRPFGRTTFSGANGIAISADADYIFVSEWARRRVYKMSTTNVSDTTSIATDFLPDNIRWMDHNALIIVGQQSSPAKLFSRTSRSGSIVPFKVILVDPISFSIRSVGGGGNRDFSSGTSAIEAGATYWIGCVGYDKIAVYFKK